MLSCSTLPLLPKELPTSNLTTHLKLEPHSGLSLVCSPLFWDCLSFSQFACSIKLQTRTDNYLLRRCTLHPRSDSAFLFYNVLWREHHIAWIDRHFHSLLLRASGSYIKCPIFYISNKSRLYWRKPLFWLIFYILLLAHSIIFHPFYEPFLFIFILLFRVEYENNYSLF